MEAIKGIIGPHKGIIGLEYLNINGPWVQGPWAQGPCAHGLIGPWAGSNMGSVQWETLTKIGTQGGVFSECCFSLGFSLETEGLGPQGGPGLGTGPGPMGP